MAADIKKKGFFMFRPKFLLFCLYVAAYVMLRMHGEVVFQQISVPGGNGGVDVFRMASANPGIPYWRQQLWRGVFSAAMVVEEEGQPVLAPLLGLINKAQERTGEGSLIDRAVEGGRSLLPNQARAPRQSSNRQPQAYAQPIEGLREGERMIYDPRVQR
jgi:hypothetical protein